MCVPVENCLKDCLRRRLTSALTPRRVCDGTLGRFLGLGLNFDAPFFSNLNAYVSSRLLPLTVESFATQSVALLLLFFYTLPFIKFCFMFICLQERKKKVWKNDKRPLLTQDVLIFFLFQFDAVEI